MKVPKMNHNEKIRLEKTKQFFSVLWSNIKKPGIYVIGDNRQRGKR
jgi:hypothetical protein